MVRWEPDARGRLQAAALDLYETDGVDGTTVAEIAQRAGLTERTFYRYFADRHEVLFDGQGLLRQRFVDGAQSVPAAASPIEMVGAALLTAAEYFPEQRRAYARRRQQVIVANAGLQERELLKMASLAAALAATLRDRGVPEPAATLSAESGVTVFRVAFELWIQSAETRALSEIEHDLFQQLGALTAVVAAPAER